MSFPTLYGKAKTGKTKEWSIYVEEVGDTVWTITFSGYIDGQKTKSSKETKKGKNIGKANETTPYEQAYAEAEKKWQDKKAKEGYSETIDDIGNVIVLPMLANKYVPDKVQKKGIVYPCDAQPKLDGIRCIAFLKDGKVILLTRKGIEFLHMDHIKEALKTVLYGDLHLDGEFYTDQLPFQEITGICRKKSLNKDLTKKQELIEFHVYDLFHLNNIEMPFEDRYKELGKLSKKFNHSIRLVETKECNSVKEMKKFHHEYISDGYEGIMLRNKAGKYQLKNRSNDLQKYKEFFDDEFNICGYHEGTGEDVGTIIWECEYTNKDGDLATFSVRPKGSREERREYFNECEEDFSKYDGAKLTVRYQELSLDRCPRFPVGIAVRDYE